ncbi:PEP-utilizing enzyme [Streptomyces sp. NPDC059909]|uniref:PEP-utilizing enzyme n=1 Tax=Streptomyces sp. NPDC059909 TaxID=3346998 RepID=UPI0036699A5F
MDEFGELRTRDVVVAPYTNPAWTPLFRRAVAVIVDRGGVASHAAIIAREYGIPGDGHGRRDHSPQRRPAGQVDGDRGLVLPAGD